MEGRMFLRCLANILPPTAYRIKLKVLVGLYIATFFSCPLITPWLCLTLIFLDGHYGWSNIEIPLVPRGGSTSTTDKLPMCRWQPSIID
jgi:hypothetical protein